MNKLLFFLLLIFTCLTSCSDQFKKSDSNKISYQEIYGFINSITKDTIIPELRKSKFVSLIQGYIGIDSNWCYSGFTKLTSVDSIEIKSQVLLIDKYEPQKDSIKFLTLITKDTLASIFPSKIDRMDLDARWEIFRKKYSEDGFVTISFPIFIRNKTEVAVKIGYCCGSLCGEGRTYILKRNNEGRWFVIETFDNWVS